jgi:hypothetical protein
MKHNLFFSRGASLACAVLLAAALTSCDDDTTAPVATPAAVAPANTPPAVAQVATAVPGPAVTVTDAGGNPVVGLQVDFVVAAGGGAFQFPTATTDEQGLASAGLWQIGPKVGTNTATVTVGALAPVSFTVTSTPGPPTKMAASSGNAQQGAPGSDLPTPLSVRVTDAGGNPKPGVDVTFAVTTGGGSLAGTTATTDASGIATSGTWTLGTGQCGQSVTGTAGSLTTIFTASSRGSITVGGSAAGDLSSTDCVFDGAYADEYNMTTPAGAVNISLTAATFTPLVHAVTSDGLALVASGASGGVPTNSSFRLITAAGDKAVRATSATAAATGPYSVSVASTSSDVNSCGITYIEIGASTDQTLAASDCDTNDESVAGDEFLVYIPANVTVQISQTSDPLDAMMDFYSPTGTLLVQRDNAGVSAATPEVILFTASTAGFYKIVATSYCLAFDDVYRANCDYGAYTLKVVKP